jgi:general secretion pathway protein D
MHYERGMRFYKSGDYDKAVSEFESVLYLDSNNKQAKKYLETAVKRRDKKIVNELYRQANDYCKQEQYQNALSAYENVLKIIPGDGYSQYQIELLKAKIEKAQKVQKGERFKKRTEELERLAQEGLEKGELLDKLEEAEAKRNEKLTRKKEAEEKRLEKIKQEKKNTDMAKDLNKVEDKVVKERIGEKVSLPAITISTAEKKEVRTQTVVAQEKDSAEKELIKKIKSLYQLGKRYYNEGDYRKSIDIFQQVIDLEGNPSITYTPYAEKFISKAEKKLVERVRLDKVKEVEDIEDDMINKVIDASKVPTDLVSGTTTKDVVLPLPVSQSEIRKKLELPVNMDFQDVEVVYVLDYLSEATSANIVMSSAVTKGKRTVTIKVKDMALEEALKYVLKSAGLTYRIDKNVIWIATPEEIENEQMETKVFILKKGKGAFTSFTSATTGSVGLGSAANIDKEINIKDTIEKAVSWPEGSKIALDERLGALIVTNTPYNLEIIDKILNKIDVEPIQVLIETRFLEVTVTDLAELGIDWQLNSDLPIDKTAVGMVQGIVENSGVNFTDTSRFTEGFNLTYQGVLTKPQFQFVLHSLEESQKVKTLSAPRVTTLDNQMATMKVVDEWIYPTRYEFQIVQNDANGDGDFNDANETQYQNVPSDFVKRDVGILLRVTPSVGIDDNTITLTLIPEVSEGTADYFSYTGDVSLPLFTSRNLSTSVVVNNGDTVALGGLIKETQTKVETKIPLLGDLPLFGKLFRKDTESVTRKNLLIFVTASVLSSSGKEVVLNRVERVQ